MHDPKRRVIAVADVTDRVMHRLIYDHLVQVWNASFCYDAWSCRTGKGLQGAINRAKSHSKKYQHGWLWRSDITKFFDSINHNHLKFLLSTKQPGQRTARLFNEVISSYALKSRQGPRSVIPDLIGNPVKIDQLLSPWVLSPRKILHEARPAENDKHSARGVPIGNLTSQIFANVYLNEFDQFVLHSLKPSGYVRYGDDFVLWFQTEAEAKAAQIIGTQFLNDELYLQVNPKHDHTQPVHKKLSYLGVVIWPHSHRLEPKTWRRIQQNLDTKSVASYQALVDNHLPNRYNRKFLWQIIDIITIL